MNEYPSDITPEGRQLPDVHEARAEEALRGLRLAVAAEDMTTMSHPASVRRRAERRALRRTVRRTLVGLLAVVGTVAVTAVLASNPADRLPRPPVSLSPSAEPTPSLSLRVAALGPAQMGTGYSVDMEGPPRTKFLSSGVPGEDCDAWHQPRQSASGHVLAAYSLMFRAPRGHFDGHDIWQFEPGWAANAMVEVRDRLGACARMEGPGDPGVVSGSEWTVLATGFAGDSLAVRHTLTRNGVLANTDFYVVVRQGDLIATLWLSDQRWTEQQMRDLGRSMAERLCAATRC